ncbi:MAG: ribosomal RNA large subunit methyltransferase H [Lysobacteraceae bacterium]|nr:MAG: ribosomal RNA large subunit methyltransferase H [Xanthomonadaceae bacterium]
MKARLVAVGTGMPGWVQQGFEEYARRLSHWLPLELVEIPPGARGRGRDPQRAAAEEGERVLAAAGPRARLVVLDGRGRSYSSEALARRLEAWRGMGQDLAFLVGGPEGHPEAVRVAASESWSLGPLTLPHPLVRIVVAEQLYRAASILAGHPYHRG